MRKARGLFYKEHGPTTDQVMQKVKKVGTLRKKKINRNLSRTQQKAIVQKRKDAMNAINKLVKALAAKECGRLDKKKPSDVYKLLFENVNSLGVFSTGKARNKKLRQLRYLLNEWEMDIASLAETQADWRHASEER